MWWIGGAVAGWGFAIHARRPKADVPGEPDAHHRRTPDGAARTGRAHLPSVRGGSRTAADSKLCPPGAIGSKPLTPRAGRLERGRSPVSAKLVWSFYQTRTEPPRERPISRRPARPSKGGTMWSKVAMPLSGRFSDFEIRSALARPDFNPLPSQVGCSRLGHSRAELGNTRVQAGEGRLAGGERGEGVRPRCENRNLPSPRCADARLAPLPLRGEGK